MEDEEMPIAEELLMQPPFQKEIDWYLKNTPCPTIAYAHLYQMRDAGWSQRCIDYKLQQIVHYSDQACSFREKTKQIVNDILQSQEDVQEMQKRFTEAHTNALEASIQQAQELENNLFEECHKPPATVHAPKRSHMSEEDDLDSV